jgi:S-adenosylmethionine-diacylglycerol 3-amino-3-carboxypropyl transferase
VSERVKFAVVREDAELEAELVRLTKARAALVVASGGCTALTLLRNFPELQVVAFDRNPLQLAHVRRKLAFAAAGDRATLDTLNQSGEFEGLFRQLRLFLEEFVFEKGSAEAFFAGRTEVRERWLASRYWPVAFSLALHDAFLHAMFGPDATQHAAPGSYPGYFQRVFERGLAKAGASRNPFLQHVLLGRYLEAPAYLGVTREPELVRGSLEDVPALERFQVVSLSNIFDWSKDDLAASWAKLLSSKLAPGAAVIVRQLNNRRDIAPFFEPAFKFDEALSQRLLEQDRSLFYERILVFERRA